MSSMFSFLRGRDEMPDEPSTELVRSENAPAETTAVALLEAAPAEELMLPPNTASTPEEALATILKALGKFLPPHDDTDPLSAANVSSISVSESSLAIGNRRGTESLGAFPAVALKGGRLNAVVRLELRGDDLDDVESALENLHASLLAARNDLWQVGFLRFAAESATSAEHVPTLDAWRKTTDYRILYEFHHEDSEGAESLIARIPIDVATDLANEATVVTDEMVRWDNEAAPTLEVRGEISHPFHVREIAMLAFLPDNWNGAGVTVSASVGDTVREQTFDSVREFRDAFDLETEVVEEEVRLRTVDLGANSYVAGRLVFPNSHFPEPILLRGGSHIFRIQYAAAQFDSDSDAVVYIRVLS